MIWFVLCVLVPGCVQAWAGGIECVAGCGTGFDAGLATGTKLYEPLESRLTKTATAICEHEGQKIVK
jgi:hypothetical protein